MGNLMSCKFYHTHTRGAKEEPSKKTKKKIAERVREGKEDNVLL